MSAAIQTREGALVLDAHKLSYHVDRVQAWEAGERIAPVSVDMALTRACGAMCSFCYAMMQESQARSSIKTTHALNLVDDFAADDDGHLIADHLGVGQDVRGEENRFAHPRQFDEQFAWGLPADQVELGYQQSHSVVQYFVERYGFWRIRRLLKALLDGSTFEDALTQEFRVKPTRLEADWRKWLLERVNAAY